MTVEARRLARGGEPFWLSLFWGGIDRDAPAPAGSSRRSSWAGTWPCWGRSGEGGAMPERSEWEAQIDRSVSDLLVELEALRLLVEGVLRDQEALGRRLDQVGARLERVDARLGALERRVAGLEPPAGGVPRRRGRREP
jgi:hypothetical protein